MPLPPLLSPLAVLESLRAHVLSSRTCSFLCHVLRHESVSAWLDRLYMWGVKSVSRWWCAGWEWLEKSGIINSPHRRIKGRIWLKLRLVSFEKQWVGTRIVISFNVKYWGYVTVTWCGREWCPSSEMQAQRFPQQLGLMIWLPPFKRLSLLHSEETGSTVTRETGKFYQRVPGMEDLYNCVCAEVLTKKDSAWLCF